MNKKVGRHEFKTQEESPILIFFLEFLQFCKLSKIYFGTYFVKSDSNFCLGVFRGEDSLWQCHLVCIEQGREKMRGILPYFMCQ